MNHQFRETIKRMSPGPFVAILAITMLLSMALVDQSRDADTGVLDSVRARSFTLVDDKGNPLARLGVNYKNGNAGLFVFDSDGRTVIELDVDQGRNAGFILKGSDGASRAGLTLVGDRQRPRLNLYASTKTSSYPVVALGVCEPGEQPMSVAGGDSGQGTIRIYDSSGGVLLREGKEPHR